MVTVKVDTGSTIHWVGPYFTVADPHRFSSRRAALRAIKNARMGGYIRDRDEVTIIEIL